MIVNFFGQTFDCQSAKKSGNTAVLNLSDGGVVKFSGVTDFSAFSFDNGNWDLHESKSERIAQSKAALASYLETHPLQWTDGQLYSITAEKQSQLTSTIVCAQADGQPPEWNSTGGICRDWDVQELVALGVYIKNRVKALVSYQQTQEIAMRNATTHEELDAIVVDYDSVPLPEATV